MKRQFRGDRLYKLVKIIVIAITILCLFIGTMQLINSEKMSSYYFNEKEKCMKQYPDSTEICHSFIDFMINDEAEMRRYLQIGVLLPIIFFGGGALIKYLFPKEKDK